MAVFRRQINISMELLYIDCHYKITEETRV
jgi:hypothetical protein